MGLTIDNRSGYDTGDLRRFCAAGLRANGVRGDVHVTIVSSPIRSRGCAQVGGQRMVLAIAAPSYSSKGEFERRLSRLLDHEAAHLRGVEHEQMRKPLLYSEGDTSEWARGLVVRYRGRAPNQMAVLRKPSAKPKTKRRGMFARIVAVARARAKKHQGKRKKKR